jgi:hypothetical protein
MDNRSDDGKGGYTLRELAVLLRVSKRTVRRYVERFCIDPAYGFHGRRAEIVIAPEEAKKIIEALNRDTGTTTSTQDTQTGATVPAQPGTTGAEPQQLDTAATGISGQLRQVTSVILRQDVMDLAVAFREHARAISELTEVMRASVIAQEKGAGLQSGLGRWTLFTGAALVTVMAVIAVAIMQHTLAIA